MSGRTTRAGALALTAALALAACGGGGNGDEESVEVIPFVPDPVGDPATGVELADADLPDCTPDVIGLRVLASGAAEAPEGRSGPSTHNVRNLALEAAPGVSCGLVGTPVVGVFPAEAAVGPIVNDPTPPAEGRTLLSGRQRLVSPLIWAASCASEDAEVMVLVNVAGTTLNAQLPNPPPCDPSRPSHAGAWAPLSGPAQLSLPLTVSLVDPPDELPQGGTAEVVVELTNDGVGSFQLDPCPVYSITFGEVGASATVRNRFNCAAAPAEVAPGESLRFAAELALPPEEFEHDFEGSLGVMVTDDYGAVAQAKPITVSTD